MITTSDFRQGMFLKIDGELYLIVSYEFYKPGKGTAYVRTKLRNIKQGTLIDRTFRSGDTAQEADIEEKSIQYLYQSADSFNFMDNQSFEEISVSREKLGSALNFLKEHLEITALVHEGEVVGIELPTFVVLEVTETEPGVKGDTAKSGGKPAKLETGLAIQVPFFINVGDKIKVDTRSGVYVERA